MGQPSRSTQYALEQLYEDQEKDFVVDTIPSAVVWLETHCGSQPVELRLRAPDTSPSRQLTLELSWNLAKLEPFDNELRNRIERLKSGRSAHREHITELAGYALALVSVSLLMPGTQIVDFRKGLPPDLIWDDTDGAIRGVEVAARSHGCWSVLKEIRLGKPQRASGKRLPGGKRKAKAGGRRKGGKASQLLNRSDIAEAYLSLWAGKGRAGEFTKVKPNE